jgi:hypothetical protein
VARKSDSSGNRGAGRPSMKEGIVELKLNMVTENGRRFSIEARSTAFFLLNRIRKFLFVRDGGVPIPTLGVRLHSFVRLWEADFFECN